MTAHAIGEEAKLPFFQELRKQRWDDHRYYHHSRINQSLHLFSSICFMTTYVMLFVDPGLAALIGWLLAMMSRQAGHFFFEPKSFDEVNDASHEYKEEIKVGYNLMRKRVLMALWALSPLMLYAWPSFFGLFEPHIDREQYLRNLSLLWLYLGLGALAFRTIHLFFIYNVQTGLVWATKILTDPFNDFRIYLKSPLFLARGEMIDPMYGVQRTLEEGGTSGDPAEH